MSFSDAYIHPLKFSHYPGKHIWISAEAQFKNLVVVKFKVAWLCGLTIRSPLLLLSLVPGFRQSLPE